MTYTKENVSDFLLASESIHYFASLCLPEVYKQQTHLLDTYIADENSLAIVCRQCGNSTIQACYVLWFLIFNQNKTIGYATYNTAICTTFIDQILELNDKLPLHIKAEFTKINRLTLKTNTGTQVIAKPMSPNSFRGLSMSVLILDLFHFSSKTNLYQFMQAVYPSIAVVKGKMIMSTNINPNGFKLYEFLYDFNIDTNFRISVIPFNKCSQYSKEREARAKSYLSPEHFLSEYCCIDKEGIDYAK